MASLIRVDNDGRVTLVHNHPDELSERERQEGVLVDSVPEEVSEPGKRAELRWSKVDGPHIVQVDRPPTLEERVTALETALGVGL